MSTNKSPTLPFVIPMYKHMTTKLDNIMSNESLDARLREAAAAAAIKLATYYDKAKMTQFNIIATSMPARSSTCFWVSHFFD